MVERSAAIRFYLERDDQLELIYSDRVPEYEGQSFRTDYEGYSSRRWEGELPDSHTPFTVYGLANMYMDENLKQALESGMTDREAARKFADRVRREMEEEVETEEVVEGVLEDTDASELLDMGEFRDSMVVELSEVETVEIQ
ncbi:MAG: hypothetical protein ABEJ07_05190 [Candidatus Nanohaloarchaea archaeon]